MKELKFNVPEFLGFMAKNGYTNAKLSKEIDLSHETINEIRHGRIQPSLKTINKMAKLFKVEPMMLMTF